MRASLADLVEREEALHCQLAAPLAGVVKAQHQSLPKLDVTARKRSHGALLQ